MFVQNMPDALDAIRLAYTRGNATAFLVHGNISDLVFDQGSLYRTEDWLLSVFGKLAICLLYDGVQWQYDRQSSYDSALALYQAESGQSQGNDPIAAAAFGLGLSQQDQSELPIAAPEAMAIVKSIGEKQALSQSGDKSASLFILQNLDVYCPRSAIGASAGPDRAALLQLSAALNSKARQSLANLIIVLVDSPESLPERLSSLLYPIQIGYPDIAARQEFYAYLTQSLWTDQETGDNTDLELDALQFAALTGGLRYRAMLEIARDARFTGALKADQVKTRKAQIIEAEYSSVLSVMESETGLDAIGGYDYVKSYLINNVITPMRNGRTKTAPVGLLFTGAPGTGKSRIAKCMARDIGFSCLELNVNRLLGRYVGESEANLERALSAIRALAPCVVFLDELDQTVKRGESGDSGVGSRLFKRLLEFMAAPDNRGRILFIGATNRPDLLDSALIRAGRMDVRIGFFLPDQAERAAILRVLGAAYGLDVSPETIDQVASQAEKTTGAELEAMIVKALQLQSASDDLTPDAALISALSRVARSTVDVDKFERLALEFVTDQDVLPERLRAAFAARQGKRQELVSPDAAPFAPGKVTF